MDPKLCFYFSSKKAWMLPGKQPKNTDYDFQASMSTEIFVLVVWKQKQPAGSKLGGSTLESNCAASKASTYKSQHEKYSKSHVK